MESRMKCRLLVCLCVAVFCFLASPVYAQGTLTGKVTDSETGDPLPGANVVVTSADVQTGAATNTSGEFSVRNLPAGTYTVIVSYIGYEKKVLTDVQVASARRKRLTSVWSSRASRSTPLR